MAALDVADAAPGVQPRAQRAEHGQIRVYASGFERDEEQAAEAVSHGQRARGATRYSITSSARSKNDRGIVSPRACGLHVDDQLKLNGLLHGQVGRLGAPLDPIIPEIQTLRVFPRSLLGHSLDGFARRDDLACSPGGR